MSVAARSTYLVPFLPGDGTEVVLSVTYISDFPRGLDGTCAFCHGDPCAEESSPTSLITAYYDRNNRWAETCPCCDGRPT